MASISVTPKIMVSIFVIAATVFPLIADGKTLFSGNFVELHGSWAQRDVSVNYPGRGQDAICGIEIKASTIVLHPRVWRDLATRLSVWEIHDDSAPRLIKAEVRTGYSPRLFYFFSILNSDYGTIQIRSRDGVSLQSVLNDVLGGGKSEATDVKGVKDVKLVAVASGCDQFQ